MTEPTTSPTEQIPEWTLGWRLKRALDFAGLSALEMAEELEVHPGTISRFMNDREMPRRAYLRVWALRTGVPFGWLMGDEGLPRVDSNHQPAGWLPEPSPNGRPGTAELATMGTPIPDLRQAIRRGARQTATQEWATG